MVQPRVTWYADSWRCARGYVQTQTGDIGARLASACRHFDIRPALGLDSSSVFYIATPVTTSISFGATGQELEIILWDVLEFLTDVGGENEVVVLELSHYRDFTTFSAFSNNQMQQLVDFISSGLSDRLFSSQAANVDVDALPLAELAREGHRVV